METCSPHACSLVMVFGFLAGAGLLAGGLIVSYWLGRLHAWRRGRVLAAEHRALDEAFPTWRNTVRSRGFREWLENQPADILEFAASMNAADSVKVLQRYQATLK